MTVEVAHAPTVTDKWVEIEYSGLHVRPLSPDGVRPFAGSARIWLSTLPVWIEERFNEGDVVQIINVTER